MRLVDLVNTFYTFKNFFNVANVKILLEIAALNTVNNIMLDY